MKVEISMTLKMTKVEETDDPEQIEKAYATIADESLTGELFDRISGDIMTELDCDVDVIEYSLKEIE